MADAGQGVAPLEMWAGIECTVARIGDTYTDQLERTGHVGRPGDLDLLADLGVQAVRYPVLWERTAPDGVARADWAWADERLGRLRALGIRPIVGLCHHGNGPRHTSVVDPSFATGLARFAGAVAARYPWIDAYTPINEPLTTARFCGLYGVWHPHGRADRTFVRALLTQCRAVVLSMRAIRRVNPRAQLVQNDDLGKTYSTPGLAARAAFDNERRWLTFDLLSGRVTPGHALWDYLRQAGATAGELDWFRANQCPPDIMGIDHYLTSERFLDDRLDRYPTHLHGSHGHVDVEAVRVVATGMARPLGLLAEAWERYRLPLAVTEVHNGSTREEQVRWLVEFWDAAQALRGAGADVRAVTAWALLGLYDWDSLLTRQRGHYEPGVFDLRALRPRPTALATTVAALAAGRAVDHPVLAAPGWWRRPDRFFYAPVDVSAPPANPPTGTLALSLTPERHARGDAARPILIVGAGCSLAAAFARLCDLRGLTYRLLARDRHGDGELAALRGALDEHNPWCVVHADCDGPDGRAGSPLAGRRPRGASPAVLAVCGARCLPLLTFSSDLVFDGARQTPYVESDGVASPAAEGHGQGEADAHVLALGSTALVARTGPLFGPWEPSDGLTRALRALGAGLPVVAADDAVCSPTFIPDLANACLDLLVDGERGLWHLATPGAMTWTDLIRRAAIRAELDARMLEAPAVAGGIGTVPYPPYRALSSERGVLLPALDDAIARYVDASAGWWRKEGRATRAS